MKFYDCATAPSPRRVRIFLAEKGLTLPTVQINLRGGEQFTPEFRALNPDCTVPALELDDGTMLTDAVAICTYIEDIHPEPALIGRDARERAVTIGWHRRVERDGFYALMEAFRNATPGLKGRAVPGPDSYEQIPALAERGRARVLRFCEMLDRRLESSQYIAGDRYSIADITAQITIDWAKGFKLSRPADAPHLERWHETVSSRPSASA